MPVDDSHDNLKSRTAPTIGIVAALHLELMPFLELCDVRRTQKGNGVLFRDCVPRVEDPDRELDPQPRSERGTEPRRRPLGDPVRIVVAESGVGLAQACRATHAILDGCNPDWIISAGFSGALDEEMQVGDIVVGTSVVHAESGRQFTIDLSMNEDRARGLYVGPLCTTDHIVRTVEEKQSLASARGAIAVDMESWGVADVCGQRSTKFMAVRVVSDDLSGDLPPEVLALLGPKGTVRAGALVGSLIKRPSSIKDLWKMREKALTAADKLARFLMSVIDQISNSRRS